MNLGEKFLLYEGISYKLESGGKGNDHDPNLSVFENYADRMKSWVPPEKYPVMLDLGAGAGDETHVFKKRGYHVVGTTLGEDNMKLAKELYNIELQEMDIHDLRFKKDSFDCAVLLHIFEHAFAPLIVVGELYRVLKPGARIYMVTPPIAEHSICIWHTNLLKPEQYIDQFSYWGFKCVHNKHIESRSVWDNHEFVFEKLPPNHPDFKYWGYLHHIYERFE